MSARTMIEAPATDQIDAVIREKEFDLDMRVVEASIPLPVLLCDTSDKCGATCASACATKVADPS